jgi:small subunit ribosomal protein S17
MDNKKRTCIGKVISDHMDKTVVVEVERTYMHPRLSKVMRTSKNYKVHDEHETAKVGDTVEIYEGKPVSKTKYMYMARVVNGK